MSELQVAIHELQVYITELYAAGDFEQASELQNFINEVVE